MILRNKKVIYSICTKKLIFLNKPSVKYYYLSKSEKNDKKNVYKNIVKNNNIINNKI